MNITRLAQFPLFEGLDDHAIRAVGAVVTEESVEAGRVVVREGDFSQDLTIIDEGTARVEHDGQEIAQLGPGDVFGEQGMMHKSQRNATVVAVTDLRMVHMTRFDLNRLKGDHPELLERLERLEAERGE